MEFHMRIKSGTDLVGRWMELFRCALAPTLEPPGGGGGSLDTTSRLLEAVLLSSKSTEILRVKDVSRIGGAHPPSMGEPDDL